ncbi:hypothetical protein NKJ02_13095, partial [Mesorhizobium sp. M0213]
MLEKKMKAISTAAPLICSLMFVGSCASPLPASFDAAKYDKMSCVELNVAMGAFGAPNFGRHQTPGPHKHTHKNGGGVGGGAGGNDRGG